MSTALLSTGIRLLRDPAAGIRRSTCSHRSVRRGRLTLKVVVTPEGMESGSVEAEQAKAKALLDLCSKMQAEFDAPLDM